MVATFVFREFAGFCKKKYYLAAKRRKYKSTIEVTWLNLCNLNRKDRFATEKWRQLQILIQRNNKNIYRSLLLISLLTKNLTKVQKWQK